MCKLPKLQMEIIKPIIQELGKIRVGIPQYFFCNEIDGNGYVKVRKDTLEYKLKNPSSTEIDFILNSPGGSPDHAYRIIRTLRHHFETVNVIVPFWAKSAATLLSLGASKIICDEAADFGPIDMQIGKERDDSPEFDSESALNDEHSVKRIETRFKEMYESL